MDKHIIIIERASTVAPLLCVTIKTDSRERMLQHAYAAAERFGRPTGTVTNPHAPTPVTTVSVADF